MIRSENARYAVESNSRSKEIALSNSVLSSTVITRFYTFLDISSVSIRSYRSGIKQFILYLNSEKVSQPKREDVILFKKMLLSNGAKPATVALYLSAIRRFFDWTESEGLYPNITRGVKSPKQDKGHKRDALSGSQLKDCIKAMNCESLEGRRNYAMFLLMATAGLRTIEIVRADIGDIQQVQGTTVLFVCGKGRSDKKEFVKLSEPVAAALSEYLKARGQVEATAPLFASCSRRNLGQRLTTRTVSSVAKKAMLKAGYDSARLTAHSLRHSAATLAIQAGMPLQEVSEFMRHSNISVTMIYVHSVNRLKSECESAITAAIFGKTAA